MGTGLVGLHLRRIGDVPLSESHVTRVVSAGKSPTQIWRIRRRGSTNQPQIGIRVSHAGQNPYVHAKTELRRCLCLGFGVRLFLMTVCLRDTDSNPRQQALMMVPNKCNVPHDILDDVYQIR